MQNFWLTSFVKFPVTGSEDGNVYILDIEKMGGRAVLNTLQGHATAVLGVSFNYDESLLATSDLEGLVIIWKRANVKPEWKMYFAMFRREVDFKEG